MKEKLAPTTISKRLQFARQVFRAAVKRKLIASNPFAEVLGRAVATTERQRVRVRSPKTEHHEGKASRETELAAEYPVHVVTAWLGNMPKIAMKHYLMVTDGDFHKAAQNQAQQAAGDFGRLWQETTQAPDNQGLVLQSAMVNQNLPESLAGEQGFEP